MKSFEYDIHSVMKNLEVRHHIVKSDRKGQAPKNNKEAHISPVLMFVIIFSNDEDFVCKTDCSDQAMKMFQPKPEFVLKHVTMNLPKRIVRP